MKLNKLISTLGLLGLILTGSNAAFASDSKIYSGGMCWVVDGSKVSQVERLSSAEANSFVRNTVNIACPIVRDSVQGTKGIRAFITVNRSSKATRPLECFLSALTKEGRVFGGRPSRFSFNGTGRVTRTLNTNGGVSGGAYGLACKLPRFSSIEAYYVEEL